MAHLGEVGQSYDGRDDTFTFQGNVLRVNPDFSELDLIDFMEKAQQVGENDPSNVTMVKDLFRGLVHKDDFETFWEACRKSRQKPATMVELYSKVVEKMADRPSEPLSASSSGQRPTATTSKEDSFHEVLLQHDGRPDLQAVAVKHYEELQRG